MTKPNDLFNRLGTGAANPAASKKGIDLSGKEPAKELKDESVAAQRPDKGHNQHKAGKTLGGAGGAAGRPKV